MECKDCKHLFKHTQLLLGKESISHYCVHPFWKRKRGISIGTGSILLSAEAPPETVPHHCPLPKNKAGQMELL